MPCDDPTRGHMMRAAVWQISLKEPNWTPIGDVYYEGRLNRPERAVALYDRY